MLKFIMMMSYILKNVKMIISDSLVANFSEIEGFVIMREELKQDE